MLGLRRFNRVMRHVRPRAFSSAADRPAILSGELLVEQSGNGLVHFKMNRVDRLNALSMSQVQTLGPYVRELAKNEEECKAILLTGEGPKAFCAGGDIRTMMEEGDSGWNLQWFATEYKCDYAISEFPRAFISLWHGIVMGGGVGVSVHGDYRVACEKTMFAMPECGIGLMPDVGGSYILPRMAQPGLGLYCGLTGHRLNGTDCLKFGLATHFTPLAKFEALTNSLKSDDLSHGNAKKVLDNFHEQPTEPSSLDDEALAWIENVFANPASLKDLATKVASGTGKTAEFCQKAFKRNCPLSMAVTFEALKRGKNYTLKQCLEQEFDLCASFTHVDNWNFKEGVTVTLFEKDRKPEWKPKTVEDVTEGDILRMFAGAPGDKLSLP